MKLIHQCGLDGLRRTVAAVLCAAMIVGTAPATVTSKKAHHKSLARLNAGLKSVRESASKAKTRLSALKKREDELESKVTDQIRPKSVPAIDASLQYVRLEISQINPKKPKELRKKLISLYDRGYTQALTLVVGASTSSRKKMQASEIREHLSDFDSKTDVLNAIDAVIDASKGDSPRTFEFAQAELKKIRFERKALTEKLKKCDADEDMILAEIDVVKGLEDERVTPRTATFIRPVPGKLTSGFGSRVHPIDHIEKEHKGIDLTAETGDPVKASAEGIVVFAGAQKGYGNIVIIRHEDSISTAYAHLSEIEVEVGDRVDQGQMIGKAGMTGSATGPHVHFEIRENDVQVDPEKYL